MRVATRPVLTQVLAAETQASSRSSLASLGLENIKPWRRARGRLQGL
jgi:hypothetical protein